MVRQGRELTVIYQPSACQVNPGSLKMSVIRPKPYSRVGYVNDAMGEDIGTKMNVQALVWGSTAKTAVFIRGWRASIQRVFQGAGWSRYGEAWGRESRWQTRHAGHDHDRRQDALGCCDHAAADAAWLATLRTTSLAPPGRDGLANSRATGLVLPRECILSDAYRKYQQGR